MTALVLAEQSGSVTRLVLNDTATRNSLSAEMMTALSKALAEIATPVAIIAANGPAFCSGHNLKEITAHRNDRDQGKAFYAALFEQCCDLMISIQSHPSAIIAEVGGMASAAGCQLVATCDLAVASDNAGFCTPGVNIGLFCSTPMVAVSRTVGRRHAMEMLLTGRVLSADEAYRIGLVNQLAPAAGLRQQTLELASLVSKKSPEAIRIGKKAFLQQQGLPVAEAYAAMAEVMADNLMCADAKEGIGAFIEKREPVWTKN
jgi:enoyl-CoA hydratase/carnithine racemase